MIRDFTKHFLRHLSLKPLSRADWLHLHSELRTTAKNQTPYVNPSKPNTIAPVKSSAPNTQIVNPNTNPQQLNKHPTPTLKSTPTVLPTVKTHKKLRDNDADDLLKAV